MAAVAIHGRTREQGFSGQVDREGIRRVVEAVERIPVIGNGDIRTIADAARMLAETGCAGISIGRGALANPWIFRQLVQWETTGTLRSAGKFRGAARTASSDSSVISRKVRGMRSAIIMFRKTAHWYLKAMRVSARLRAAFRPPPTRPKSGTPWRPFRTMDRSAGTALACCPICRFPSRRVQSNAGRASGRSEPGRPGSFSSLFPYHDASGTERPARHTARKNSRRWIFGGSPPNLHLGLVIFIRSTIGRGECPIVGRAGRAFWGWPRP